MLPNWLDDVKLANRGVASDNEIHKLGAANICLQKFASGSKSKLSPFMENLLNMMRTSLRIIIKSQVLQCWSCWYDASWVQREQG